MNRNRVSFHCFHLQRHVQMTPADLFPRHLANLRLEGIPAFRHADAQIQEAMIYTAQTQLDSPAALLDARLRVSGHGFQCSLWHLRRGSHLTRLRAAWETEFPETANCKDGRKRRRGPAI